MNYRPSWADDELVVVKPVCCRFPAAAPTSRIAWGTRSWAIISTLRPRLSPAPNNLTSRPPAQPHRA